MQSIKILGRASRYGLILSILSLQAELCIAQQAQGEFPANAVEHPAFKLSHAVELGLNYSEDKNFNLNNSINKDSGQWGPNLEVSYKYRQSKQAQAYLSLELSWETKFDEKNNSHNDSQIEIKEVFVELDNLYTSSSVFSDVNLTFGRRKVSDEHEWLFDTSLDGMQLGFAIDNINTEFRFSLGREDAYSTKLLTYLILSAEYKPTKTLSLFAHSILQEDRSDDGNEPIFHMLGLTGKTQDDRLRYWTQFATVRGKDGNNTIHGNGYDIGTTYTFEIALQPYFTISYAFGSGSEDKKSGFRQTGLHGNSDKRGGISSTKYYGELLNPDLDNLRVITAGIGFHPASSSSIDLVFHHYTQDIARDKLAGNELNIDPDGQNKQLGNEADLVFAWEGFSNLETELTLGMFVPDDAFRPNSDTAYIAKFKVNYKF
jgi:alginate production protein